MHEGDYEYLKTSIRLQLSTITSDDYSTEHAMESDEIALEMESA